VKVGIMQPYFFPYVGYFQLIAAVDVFVVYDNIKYVKSGWINRNRMLRNGEAVTFSLPLKGASDDLDVCDREIAADFRPHKLLNQIKGGYGQAPEFGRVFPLIERIVRFEDRNLFRFLHHSIRALCQFLGIGTEIRVSSGFGIDHSLRKQHKVLALCRALGAVCYLNAIGGMELYAPEEFRRAGVELKFVRSRPFEYRQLGAAFVPSLSIIDMLMFNPAEAVRDCVFGNYELI
jgi:WbqC-like protein family